MNRSFISGMLFAAGILLILDNIFIHWVFGLHRFLPGNSYTTSLEIFFTVVGIILLIISPILLRNKPEKG